MKTPTKLATFLASIPAADDSTFVVIVPYYWGRGATVEEALANIPASKRKAPMVVRRQANASWRQHVADFPDATVDGEPAGEKRLPYVDSFGAFCWFGDASPEKWSLER